MLLLILGCATEPAVKMPASPPSGVKAYKDFTLWAGSPGMKRTGVYLDKRDVYTILASGKMDYCSKGGCAHRDVRPEHGWPLVSRVGNGKIFSTLPPGDSGVTLTALETGELFFGYRGSELLPSGEPKRPDFFIDDAGSYSITIITWARDDYQGIAAFLRDLKQKEPQNKAVNAALVQAERISKIQVAAHEASNQIEQTKKEIQDLKAAPPSPPEEHAKDETKRPLAEPAVKIEAGPASLPATVSVGKEQDIAKLEAKLAKLTEQLTQLDTMKKGFEDERKRSEALARELEQKEKTEQSLI